MMRERMDAVDGTRIEPTKQMCTVKRTWRVQIERIGTEMILSMNSMQVAPAGRYYSSPSGAALW
jgi:hypothetical protein